MVTKAPARLTIDRYGVAHRSVFCHALSEPSLGQVPAWGGIHCAECEEGTKHVDFCREGDTCTHS